MKRLMSDRDHLEALVFAVENLEKDKEIPTTDSLLRLLNSAKRARQDLFPNG